MFRNAPALIAVSVLLMGSPAATAEPAGCAARSIALNHLSSRYAETPVAMGLTNNGAMMEILSSKSGKSWTIILTMPNGVTCLVSAGENLETIPRFVDTGPAA